MSCFTTTLPLLTQHTASSSAVRSRQQGIRRSLLAELKIIATDETGQVLEPPLIEGSRAELDYNRDDLNCETDAAETLAAAVLALLPEGFKVCDSQLLSTASSERAKETDGELREDCPAAAVDPANEVEVAAELSAAMYNEIDENGMIEVEQFECHHMKNESPDAERPAVWAIYSQGKKFFVAFRGSDTDIES
jgi:hypothetical protein